MENKLKNLVWAAFFFAAAIGIGFAVGLMFSWLAGLVAAATLGLLGWLFYSRFRRSLVSTL